MYIYFNELPLKKIFKPLQKRDGGIIMTDAYLYIIFMYRSLMFLYCRICQCMHGLVYETIKYEEKETCHMILFLFKPSINETYMTLSDKSYKIHIDETDL